MLVRILVLLQLQNYISPWQSGGGKPYALTKRSGDLPEEEDNCIQHLSQVVPKLSNIATTKLYANTQTTTPFKQLWSNVCVADPFPNEVIGMINNGVKKSKLVPLSECSISGNKLIFRNRLWVPDDKFLQPMLLQQHHDIPTAGHPGRAKTFEILAHRYNWPSMRKDVDQYVANCHYCHCSKALCNALPGFLKPLPMPEAPWKHNSMDFVSGLPWSDGSDCILVVVHPSQKCDTSSQLPPLSMQKKLPNYSPSTSSSPTASHTVLSVTRVHSLFCASSVNSAPVSRSNPASLPPTIRRLTARLSE